jgi:polyhydroxyalkanoate synthesis regulator phasin
VLGEKETYSEKPRVLGNGSGLVLRVLWKIAAILIFSVTALAFPAREKDATQYGAGLIMNLTFPESEVTQVVQDVIQNGIIRGTKEYNKDEYITGAVPATSTRVFPEWTEGGKVFYKERLKAIDPRNFKDSGDVGTLVVRYVVQPQGDKNTVLRIDARFVEDFRKTSHPSNGSVESAEYKDIHDHLDAIESMRAQTVEAEKEKQEQLAKKEMPALADETPPNAPQSTPANTYRIDAPSTGAPPSPPQTLEEHVQDLRRQVQRLVKAPGAALKSAPFHTASSLQSLPTGTEVLIVISTTYWLGVETHDGQHGWILRDELELLP